MINIDHDKWANQAKNASLESVFKNFYWPPMTFSLLTLDRSTGQLGGASATGNLCVGGWVLRGDAQCGLSASQGAEPSVLWGEDVLAGMKAGGNASEAVSEVTAADPRREWRQLAALDRSGGGGVFSGRQNGALVQHLVEDDLVVAGNILANDRVLTQMMDGFHNRRGDLADRLLAALRSGSKAGGDSRGLMSAAMLIVAQDKPTLTLRVDYDEKPIDKLESLLALTRDPTASGSMFCPQSTGHMGLLEQKVRLTRYDRADIRPAGRYITPYCARGGGQPTSLHAGASCCARHHSRLYGKSRPNRNCRCRRHDDRKARGGTGRASAAVWIAPGLRQKHWHV